MKCNLPGVEAFDSIFRLFETYVPIFRNTFVILLKVCSHFKADFSMNPQRPF